VITANLKPINFGFKLTGMFHLRSNWQSLSVAGDNAGRVTEGGGNQIQAQCIKDQTQATSIASILFVSFVLRTTYFFFTGS
jgi:hypothetical protein